MLTNYFLVLTFYLSQTETESSLLLVFKGCSLRLIVCIINTSFHIHFPFFISWKQNIKFIWRTCWGWATDLFDMNLVEEYKMCGGQLRKLGFIITWWYMPYLHLSPFVFSKQYGEGENKSSCYLCFCLKLFCHFDIYLLFILWKTVEHYQPLFCLALSCFFPLTLILFTLLNILFSCNFRYEYRKGYIDSGTTQCINYILVAMTIEEIGGVRDAKSVFHRIC